MPKNPQPWQSLAVKNRHPRDLQIELIDRFGLLPDSVKRLFLTTELKRFAESLGVTRIHVSNDQCTVEFNDNPLIDPGVLIRLIQVHSKRYHMHGPNRLRFTLDSETPEARIGVIKALLIQLSGKQP